MSNTPYLFLVHPGSALGSAAFNLGQFLGRAARNALAQEISGWRGHIITLSGMNDDEIPSYPMFAESLASAADNAGIRGHHHIVREAHDPDQDTVALEIAAELDIPKHTPIICTGAWASDDDSGCVNSVRDALKKAGYTNVVISEMAVYESEGQAATDDDADE